MRRGKIGSLGDNHFCSFEPNGGVDITSLGAIIIDAQVAWSCVENGFQIDGHDAAASTERSTLLIFYPVGRLPPFGPQHMAQQRSTETRARVLGTVTGDPEETSRALEVQCASSWGYNSLPRSGCVPGFNGIDVHVEVLGAAKTTVLLRLTTAR